jgi:metal-responsive CopG/Arc/MetJ family transcriptional regulator
MNKKEKFDASVTALIPQKMRDQIDDLIKLEEATLGDIVRDALAVYLKKTAKKKEKDQS